MDVGKIISNSIRYPFRNIKKLPILFVLFILVAIIPIGIIYDNRYVVIAGTFAFFLFILIVPGYLLSFIQIGLNESSMFPTLNFVKNIYNTLRLLVLRIAYMIVPAAAFLIILSTWGVSSMDMLNDFNIPGFILTMGFILVVLLSIYIVFEVLLFFAKARLAYLDSLTEALKIHKVIGDIRSIGIVNILKWIIFMVVLMIVVYFISSWVMLIPYVGFLIYICVVIPILESIGNYSLGLLYSNITHEKNELAQFERELQSLKYLN